MNKGFTLIELLAVIVILAIIALIATPIIINIINDSRDQANKRSVELYKSAIENAIIQSNFTATPVGPGTLSSEFLQTIQYDGATVTCTTNVLYSDGTIYLDGCTVGSDTKTYSYGTSQYMQVYKPEYYVWQEAPATAIGDGGYYPETQSSVPPEGKTFYLGYDLHTNGQTTQPGYAYVCFNRNGNEYCLKSCDVDAYSVNIDILRDAFSDVVDDPNHCTFNDEINNLSYCEADEFSVMASEEGELEVMGNYYNCRANEFGHGSCAPNNYEAPK